MDKLNREKLEKALDEMCRSESLGMDNAPMIEGFQEGFKFNQEILVELVLALEFYASNDNYFGPQYIDNKRYFLKLIESDASPVSSQERLIGGKKARETLQKFYAKLGEGK
jgi:hypothetical protein